jgi:hypothetical protein
MPHTQFDIADEVPWAEEVTGYDRAHLDVYLRLLDAKAAHATHHEICRFILKIDPAREPARARKAHHSHLRRAIWLTKRGYQDLLRRGGVSGDHLNRLM